MTAIHDDRRRAEAAAERLRVYAQPQRLMILSLLLQGERSVGAIEAGAGVGQPALSQQLAELRRAGLVKTRRVARQVLYRLADADVARCVEGIEGMMEPRAPDTTARVVARRPPTSRAPNAAVAFAMLDTNPQRRW